MQVLPLKRMASNKELVFALVAKKKKGPNSKENNACITSKSLSRMDSGLHHALYTDLCADEKKYLNFFKVCGHEGRSDGLYTAMAATSGYI